MTTKYIFIIIAFLFISCQDNKLSQERIDSIVKEINETIEKNQTKIIENKNLKTFVGQMRCYSNNKKLVKINAIDGSPFGYTEFSFYLFQDKLIFSEIEYCDLKAEFVNTMDTVRFNKNNSEYDIEKMYFLDSNNQLLLKNDKIINKDSKKRKKIVEEQYTELLNLCLLDCQDN
jgi:hypothetical protein